MEWKSFIALKQGRRQMPRIEELEALATLLEVEPAFVFQVARGLPPDEIASAVAREHRWRALLERATDAIFTIDADGRLQDANRKFGLLMGRGAAELIGRPLLDMVAPESAARLLAFLGAVARGGEGYGLEIGLRDSQARDRLVQLDGARIEDTSGAPIGAQLTARDVTEERRLVRELDEKRRLLQTIYECVPAACILFDRDGTILSANPTVENVCEYRSTDIVGRNAFDVFGDPGANTCPVTRAFLTAQTEQQVSWVVNRAGQRVYVHRIAGPVVLDGVVEKVIEVLVDVTRQIEMGDVRILALCSGPIGSEESGTPEERRTAPRAVTSFPARYTHGEHETTATVTSLGAGGAFLQASEESGIAVGDEIDLEWSLPGDAVPVRARGVVVWTRASSPLGPGGLGIRFVRLNSEFAAITRGPMRA